MSIVLPVLNEEAFLEPCLESILSNDYDSQDVEILIVDGGSSDRTRSIARKYAARYDNITLLLNPARYQAAALNLGLRHARGRVIVRMDAHATYEPDYIAACVDLLESSKAANVGGPRKTKGDSYLSKTIAAALRSRFASGNARHYTLDYAKDVETVQYGAWYRTTLEALGGFNETCIANEDYELNYRLRRSGGSILLSPRIRYTYFVRDSFPALAWKNLRYGFWKSHCIVLHPRSVRARQVMPALFLLAMIATVCLTPFYSPLAFYLLCAAYAALNAAASVRQARTHGWRYLLLLPVVFAAIHLFWGLGSLTGGIWFGLRKLVSPVSGRLPEATPER